jgi:hypothetical protein
MASPVTYSPRAMRTRQALRPSFTAAPVAWYETPAAMRWTVGISFALVFVFSSLGQ